MDAEKTSCSRVLDKVREISSDLRSKLAASGRILPNSAPNSPRAAGSSAQRVLDIVKPGEMEKGLEDEDPDDEVLGLRHAQGERDVYGGRSHPGWSSTTDPTRPRMPSPTRELRERSFRNAPFGEVSPPVTTPRSPRRASGILLRGVGTPTFVAERQQQTPEPSSPRREGGNLLRGEGTPTFVAERHPETPEQQQKPEPSSPGREQNNLFRGVETPTFVLDRQPETPVQTSPRRENDSLLRGVGTPALVLERQPETPEQTSPRRENDSLFRGVKAPPLVLERQPETPEQTSPRREHGNLLRGVGTPAYLLEKQQETPEQSSPRRDLEDSNRLRVPGNPTFVEQETAEQRTRQPIVRRPTGWPSHVPPKHVEWKEEVEADAEDAEPEFKTQDSTHSNWVETDDQFLDQGDTTNSGSESSSSSSSSSPGSELADQTSLNCETLDKLTGATTRATIDPESMAVGEEREDTSNSTTSSSPSWDSSLPPSPRTTQIDINPAPDSNGNSLQVGQQDNKSHPSKAIVGASCPMRSEVRYLRRRSSSGLPTQESDLLKEWTRKRDEDLQSRTMKSKVDHQKILQAAQQTRDAFYAQRKIEMDAKRAKNREKEKEIIEEAKNPMIRVTNRWEVVVSLIDLERPTGVPTEKDVNKSLGNPSSQVASMPSPPVGNEQVKNVAGYQLSNSGKGLVEKNVARLKSSNSGEVLVDKNVGKIKLANAGESDIVVENKPPPLKNTDLARMKEVVQEVSFVARKPDEVLSVTLAPRTKKSVSWAPDTKDSETCRHCARKSRNGSRKASPTRRYLKSLVTHLLA